MAEKIIYDLIFRQEAITKLREAEYVGTLKDEGGYVQRHRDFVEMYEIIRDLPTADVQPVVRGEWIKMDKRGNNVRCSKCGNTLDLRGVNAGRGDANYCPNCGAKMSTQSNAFLTH